ncbi:hypothetical protein P7H20_24845 [Paenibacillus larvae]|nr:hypothetical protein [Paenibacillus larvae]MDT2277415.1 hypothetical protein [Paenibacillus larvae]
MVDALRILPKENPADYFNAPIETVIKQIIKHNYVNPVDQERTVPGLICAPDQGRGEKIEVSNYDDTSR